MKQTVQSLEQSYKEILESFLYRKSELGPYEAQQFSKTLLEQQLSPEELVNIHRAVLEEIYPSVRKEVLDSFDFLLEVMIGYGLVYREAESLRDRQQKLDAEMDVAADMQRTLLPVQIPQLDCLDIGVISIPASKMSGDYYNFILDDHGCLGLVVADIIGKGVPAALCMSMIKYAMESLPEQRLQPGALLESLNRVVERNVDDRMFVTMMYGAYDSRTHQFFYSGAGHEPGLFYHSETDQFKELYAKGVALGLKSSARYKEYQLELNVGDFIVFLTDGLTDCRVDGRFIEYDEIISIIRKFMHLPVQKLVNSVYKKIKLRYTLDDDFTLMIVRRKV